MFNLHTTKKTENGYYEPPEIKNRTNSFLSQISVRGFVNNSLLGRLSVRIDNQSTFSQKASIRVTATNHFKSVFNLYVDPTMGLTTSYTANKADFGGNAIQVEIAISDGTASPKTNFVYYVDGSIKEDYSTVTQSYPNLFNVVPIQANYFTFKVLPVTRTTTYTIRLYKLQNSNYVVNNTFSFSVSPNTTVYKLFQLI